MPLPPPSIRQLPPAAAHRVVLARRLRLVAKLSQPVVMIALIVLWQHFHVPFWTSVEWCLLAGVSLYTALGLVGSILMTLAGLQPVGILVSQATRLASIGVFVFLRYAHDLGIFKSAATWGVIYMTALLLTRRMETRTRRRLSI